jgi:hypothetical protein
MLNVELNNLESTVYILLQLFYHFHYKLWMQNSYKHIPCMYTPNIPAHKKTDNS